MFDLLAAMAQQPQTRGSSKGSERAAPVTMAPARLLQLGPQKNNLWASLSWKDASFWGRHGSPSHRDGNSPWYQLPGSWVVGCMCWWTNTATAPIPAPGMLRGTQPPPSQCLAKRQLNVPTACVPCDLRAGLLLALISQCQGASPQCSHHLSSRLGSWVSAQHGY